MKNTGLMTKLKKKKKEGLDMFRRNLPVMRTFFTLDHLTQTPYIHRKM